ncbi:TPA: hypothetical protein ACXJQO_003497 [Serratia marcescens]|jgi:hypothetical protein|uniref:Uncharacterized protein n=1 Tax=Serratia marcescens TaxID=615 RepID=A0A2K2J345_SERMA|nr:MULTISPECIES: hypothetical protein [Serratia]KAB5502408.1 hypothetical protein F8564_00045 [Enterobacter sp. RJAL6]AUO04151.1 hypothetical protein C0558_21130 [Serratia marcescens]AYU90680.1 hypothetical protein EDY99_10140 [Serratia sp. LS-1]EMD1303545.1 hypothetical protein [Serratia marcescens]KFD12437.1 hypothetical protein GSMA_03120 [Serratia marcescens subsp. marcescens ATCC 13880]
MATNKKDAIRECAFSSLNNVVSFAKFVSYAEDLAQLNELFEDEKSRDNYLRIWFELEIINALALSEWEDEGRPVDWKTQWESSYKEDASELMNELMKMLK